MAGAAYIDRGMEDMARKIRLSSICPLLLLAVFVYVLRSHFSMNLWSRLSMFTASDLLSLILCPWFTASDSLPLIFLSDFCLYYSASISLPEPQ